jgi:hypothetical protein
LFLCGWRLDANLRLFDLWLLEAKGEPDGQFHGNLSRPERLLLRLLLQLSDHGRAAAILLGLAWLVATMWTNATDAT